MIDGSSMLFDKQFAHGQQGLKITLSIIFHSYLANIVDQRSVDTLRISPVAFIAGDKRFDGFGIHQSDGVTELLKLASPILRARAGFHPDQTSSAIGELIFQILTSELEIPDFTVFLINTEKLKDILGDIDAILKGISGIILNEGLLLNVGKTFWHFVKLRADVLL